MSESTIVRVSLNPLFTTVISTGGIGVRGPSGVAALHSDTHEEGGTDPLTLTSVQISDLASAITAGITSWIGAAPGTLDTLLEIANQLATDQSAVGALTSAVAGKLAIASNLSDVANVTTARTNLGAASSAVPAVGFPVAGQSNLAQVRFVGVLNHAGPPVSGDGTFVANDICLDNTAQQYLCSVSGTPGTWLAVGSGKVLGSVTMNTNFTMTTAATLEDIPGASCPFTPDGRPLRFVCTPLGCRQDLLAATQITAIVARSSDNAIVRSGFRQTTAGLNELQTFVIDSGPMTVWPTDSAAFTPGVASAVKLRITSGAGSKATATGALLPYTLYVITA